MDKSSYEAIKLKLEQDRFEIEMELSTLREKKDGFIKTKLKEQERLSYSTKILKEQKTVKASMLRYSFDYELVKKCEREIAIVDSYINEVNMELEKIKEQEKYLEGIFKQKLEEKSLRERKKEEEALFELKKWSDF